MTAKGQHLHPLAGEDAAHFVVADGAAAEDDLRQHHQREDGHQAAVTRWLEPVTKSIVRAPDHDCGRSLRSQGMR